MPTTRWWLRLLWRSRSRSTGGLASSPQGGHQPCVTEYRQTRPNLCFRGRSHDCKDRSGLCPVRLRSRCARATPDTLCPDDLRSAAPRVARQGEAWWGKKDSNLRSHKTADLQSAPFATRDTPPLNPIASPPAGMATDMAMDDVKTGRRWRTPGRAVYGGIAMAKSTNGRRLIRAARGPNCHNAEPVTQACHGRS
jgi:hypothetical protein